MPSLEGFYPAQFGAYESSYNGESRILGIGDGCKKPVCLKTKIVFKGLKPTRVPNMECTSKWEAYNRCLSAAGASDVIDVGGAEEEVETPAATPAPKKKPAVSSATEADSGFEFTTPVIIGIAAFIIVLIISLVLIIRAMRNPAPAVQA